MLMLILGAVSTVAVMLVTVFLTFSHSGVSGAILLNIPSIFMIFAGTAAIFFFVTPMPQIRSFGTGMMKLFRRSYRRKDLRQALIELSLNKKADSSKHPLLIEARRLWGLTLERENFLTEVMKKKDDIERALRETYEVTTKLSNYPGGLGMCGTVLGLVAMLANLTGSAKNIGPAMAVALVSTFYGLIASSFILKPLSDRIKLLQTEEEEMNEFIVISLMQICDGVPLDAIGAA